MAAGAAVQSGLIT